MANETNIPRYIFGIGDGFLVVALENDHDLGLVACRSIQAASRIGSDTPGATIFEVTASDLMSVCKQLFDLGVGSIFVFEISGATTKCIQRIPLNELLFPTANDGQHRHGVK
jgi:hypothetical protein